jgi:hypothetical protein
MKVIKSVMRTMECKRKYKYDQLMKVIRSVMRTMKYYKYGSTHESHKISHQDNEI